MHYYQHNIGDYARDTGHLTILEHGIYRLILDWCYLNEKPITTEQAMRIGRGNPTETQSVLSEFFLPTDIGWEHKRVAFEVAAYNAKSLKNKQNGQKGGRPKTENNPVGFQSVSELEAKQTLTNNQEPITNNQKELCASPAALPSPIPERQKTEASGTRLPKDWELPDSWRQWAERERPDLDAGMTADQFRDFWVAKPGKDGRKADWQATWRNWCRSQKAQQGAILRKSTDVGSFV